MPSIAQNSVQKSGEGENARPISARESGEKAKSRRAGVGSVCWGMAAPGDDESSDVQVF